MKDLSISENKCKFSQHAAKKDEDFSDERNKLVLRIAKLPNSPERCHSYSRQKSLSNSEFSLSSSQCSPQPVLDKKATYWTIHRGDYYPLYWIILILITPDLGTLDPALYLVDSEQHYDVNIALKYSILEDIVSIIIFKCNFQVRKRSLNLIF